MKISVLKLRQENPFGWNEMYRQLVLNLLGKSQNVCYLKGEAYNEELLLPIIIQANERLGIHIFYANKLILCYLFAEYSLALENAQSVLCSPILYQGKLLGVLYLENKLAIGAFTGDRVELLNILCAQAAISLENAQLYQRTLKYAQQLEESFTELSTSNSRFEKLVDNVPGVVYQYRISVDGVISLPYISADCYQLYEITAKQAIANVQSILERIHPDDVASHQQSIMDSMQTLIPWMNLIMDALLRKLKVILTILQLQPQSKII